MSKVIIDKYTCPKKQITGEYLKVSQLFYDTVQGEGIYAGTPAIFLRLHGCTLNCLYCDTKDIWKEGVLIEVDEIIDIFSEYNLFFKLQQGAHLVITGGSPLLQQKALSVLFENLAEKGLEKFPKGFLFFIEMENECIIKPTPEILRFVTHWNNSPKLPSSGYTFTPPAPAYLKLFSNSTYKFVIQDEEDWQYLQRHYIETGVLKKKQIILMPCAKNKKELLDIQEFVMSLCIKENIRYGDRLHIRFWDDKKDV